MEYSKQNFTAEENAILQPKLAESDDISFQRLYCGNYCDYSSWDEADQALCDQLAVLCHGNEKLIDSLFRKSGMTRPDWDESCNGVTCGQSMIKKAICKFEVKNRSGKKD